MGRTLWKRTCTALAVALLTLSGGYAHSVPATPSDTMEQDIDAAVQGVDSFWAKHWSEYFTETYSSPNVVGLYDGTATDAPTCDGQKLDMRQRVLLRSGGLPRLGHQSHGQGLPDGGCLRVLHRRA